jgi:hypothetical protein
MLPNKIKILFYKKLIILMSIRPLRSILSFQLIAKIYRSKINLQNKELYTLSNSEIFSTIYSKRLWGKGDAFNSGLGTTSANVKLYIDFVSLFIKNYNITSIVDIGCGDFKVGNKIITANPLVRYHGLDIVKSLIDYNNSHHTSENIVFSCVDATQEQLPGADLCLIRQVFQHLCNNQIINILAKLHKFKYVLITEHIPMEKYLLEVNKDKDTGPDIRIYDGSGVFIQYPPFNINCEEVLSYREDIASIKAEIKTFLIRN